jgi:hypothetical protein
MLATTGTPLEAIHSPDDEEDNKDEDDDEEGDHNKDEDDDYVLTTGTPLGQMSPDSIKSVLTTGMPLGQMSPDSKPPDDHVDDEQEIDGEDGGGDDKLEADGEEGGEQVERVNLRCMKSIMKALRGSRCLQPPPSHRPSLKKLELYKTMTNEEQRAEKKKFSKLCKGAKNIIIKSIPGDACTCCVPRKARSDKGQRRGPKTSKFTGSVGKMQRPNSRMLKYNT